MTTNLVTKTEAVYDWVPFYEELATKLVEYRSKQPELIAFLKELRDDDLPVVPLNDMDKDKSRFLLEEICPFTFFASFNRQITPENRKTILAKVKNKFHIEAPVPSGFSGIPVVNNQNSWFFPYKYKRKADDIDRLWDLLAAAVGQDPLNSSDFQQAFKRCAVSTGLRFKLTMALFWIRPNQFLNLDKVNRNFLNESIKKRGFNFDFYKECLERVKKDAGNKPLYQLSHEAYEKRDPRTGSLKYRKGPDTTGDGTRSAYTVEDARSDGLFLSNNQIELARKSLEDKKNIVLQGPPGVGKTFFADKLAYIFLGEKNDKYVQTIQFHPSYTYEDFVRGYRPSIDGTSRFVLKDGPFLELCKKAIDDEDHSYILIIDEINRANLSQVFGELFLLLEKDKRGRSVTPMYAEDGEQFTIPENLYIIGTMNTADRSLALVDFALRRRFAFITLEPCFDELFADWLIQNEMNSDLVSLICSKLNELNGMISEDRQLGQSYCVGHSFFCPNEDDLSHFDTEWYQRVVESEILPLLKEYWHEREDDLNKAMSLLLV